MTRRRRPLTPLELERRDRRRREVAEAMDNGRGVLDLGALAAELATEPPEAFASENLEVFVVPNESAREEAAAGMAQALAEVTADSALIGEEPAWTPPALPGIPPPPARVLPEALPPAPPDLLPVEAEAQAATDLEHAPKPSPLPPAGAGRLGNRRLDWTSRHDPKSLQFALRRLLSQDAPLTSTSWPHGPVLDQGDNGACVGFAVAAAANGLALMPGSDLRFTDGDALGADDAQRLFTLAKTLDDYTGEDATSLLAGMKAGQAAGLWKGYAVCLGTRDIAQALVQGLGPVLLGLPWLSEMHAGPDGVLQLHGTAGLGHALVAVNLLMTYAGRPGPWFQLQQSWGLDEGDAGMVYVHHRDLAQLLAGQGEAFVALSEKWEASA